ncbi:hypothetical protein OG216_19690 [Streptomycetaceae bacterium NBC_01309]
MTGRPYCRCTVVQNYDYAGAAAKLGCKRSWLEDNISRLPHQKFGSSPVFCDCELALIQAMNTVLPPAVLALLSQNDAKPQPEINEAARTLATIQPARARGRRTA